MKKILTAAAVLFLAAGLYAQGQGQKLKVYISVDMEGITGIVNAAQTIPDSPEYAQARKWMAADVNAAIEGAIRAGATEIVVNDAHGSMRNIDPDDLNPKAVLITGSPKPLSMMEGIDDSFACCLFVGYHAMSGTENGVLDHTISGGVVRSVKINGVELPELGINAAVAGFFGVPVVFLSGDVAVCQQAKTVLGNDIVTTPVKTGIWRYAARLVPAAEARKAIRDRAYDAVKRAKQFKPFKIAPPCAFELEYYVSAQADMASIAPQVKRLDARRVMFAADDIVQGVRFLRVLIALAPGR